MHISLAKDPLDPLIKYSRVGSPTTRSFLAFPDATAIAYTEKTRQGYLLYGMQ
jgi:hypothetical protein